MNMKKQILSIIFGAIVLAFLLGTLQAQPVTLTFTGRDAASQYIQLDMVSVTNVTRGWQEYLFWNDTVLVMDNQIGIHEVETRGGAWGRGKQKTPNPFVGTPDAPGAVDGGGRWHGDIGNCGRQRQNR